MLFVLIGLIYIVVVHIYRKLHLRAIPSIDLPTFAIGLIGQTERAVSCLVYLCFYRVSRLFPSMHDPGCTDDGIQHFICNCDLNVQIGSNEFICDMTDIVLWTSHETQRI